MPIFVDAELRRPTPDEFSRIAYEVVGCFFRAHREMSRLFDEKIYKREVARRLRNSELEVPITVTFDGFEKKYSLDLLVESSAVFEIKSVDNLAPEHRAQLLNYLLLTELPRGKLINVRPDLVQHEFVNTTLRLSDRRKFEVDDRCWQPLSAEDSKWKGWITCAIRDWGTGLDLSLYEEAIAELLGGVEIALRETPVVVNGERLETQKILASGTTAMFKVTAIYDAEEAFQRQLQLFLDHMELEAIQWLNIQRHLVEFRTLVRGPN